MKEVFVFSFTNIPVHKIVYKIMHDMHNIHLLKYNKVVPFLDGKNICSMYSYRTRMHQHFAIHLEYCTCFCQVIIIIHQHIWLAWKQMIWLLKILAIQIQPTQQVLKNNIHIIFITILNKGNARKYSKWCPFHRRGGGFK